MKFIITAHPDAIQFGYIDIPDDVDEPLAYIEDNFKKIEFDKPLLTYDLFELEYEPVCE